MFLHDAASAGPYAVFGEDGLADRICGDDARFRILDGENCSVDLCVDVRIFKGEVRVLHTAVDEFQPIAVTERLRPRDHAVDQRQAIRIPAEIFSPDERIFHRHVLGMPECVFGVERAVFRSHVFDVLKGIFPRERDVVKLQVFGKKEGVFALQRGVFNGDAAALPAEFRGDDLRVFNLYGAAFSERLDPFEPACFDFDLLGVPERGAAAIRHDDVFQRAVFAVPQGIAQVHAAALQGDVFRFLERGFPVLLPVERAVDQADVSGCVQIPLMRENFVSDDLFHGWFRQFTGEIPRCR